MGLTGNGAILRAIPTIRTLAIEGLHAIQFFSAYEIFPPRSFCHAYGTSKAAIVDMYSAMPLLFNP